MSSMNTLGVHKCESCGHLIGRGRLTCSHCGAAASIKTELTAGIDFYKTINEDFEKYYEALRQLFYYSVNVNTFFSGNDVTAEVQFENFLDFWKEISIRKHTSHGTHESKRDGVRLFKSFIKVSKDVSFFRFIAVDKGILYLCEINAEAKSYLSEKKFEEQKAKQARKTDRKIKELNSILSNYKIDLEYKQAKKLELEEAIKEWKSKSWLERRKTKCVTTEAVITEIAETEKSISKLNSDIARRKQGLY